MWLFIKDADVVPEMAENLRAAGFAGLAEEIDKRLAEQPERAGLVEKAEELYAHGSDNDIEVDPDAALSENDEGNWVMMWGFVRNDDLEDEDVERNEPYGHCDTCGSLCDKNGCVGDRSHVIANPSEASIRTRMDNPQP